MTTEQFYREIGSDYAAVLERLGAEDMIRRFVLKFPQDPSFSALEEGFAKRDAEVAFRAAHTLKGVCANLGFDRLYAPAAALTEKLRGRAFTEGADALYHEVAQAYRLLIDAIGRIG